MKEPVIPLALAAGLELFARTYMPARGLAQRTRQEYYRDVRDLVQHLKQYQVLQWHEVTLAQLRDYMAKLDGRKLKASSRNRKTYAIRSFFTFLLEDGYILNNPAEKLIPPKIPKKEPRFLSDQEYLALLAQISNTRDKAIVVLFLQVGLRLTELACLNRGDIQLPNKVTKDPQNVGLVRVIRKGGKEEYLPLNWKACEALKTWFRGLQSVSRQKEVDKTAVFINKFGQRLSQRSIQRMLEKYLEQAGIEDASVHTLRHTMATHYLAKGGDIRSVQQMLGHESLETTQIYLGMAKKVQSRMVQELAL